MTLITPSAIIDTSGDDLPWGSCDVSAEPEGIRNRVTDATPMLRYGGTAVHRLENAKAKRRMPTTNY